MFFFVTHGMLVLTAVNLSLPSVERRMIKNWFFVLDHEAGQYWSNPVITPSRDKLIVLLTYICIYNKMHK